MKFPKTSVSFPLFSLNREKAATTGLPATARASNFSIFKRLLNLSLLVISAVICIKLWLVHNQQEENWYQQQANQLGRSLAMLSAQMLVQGVAQQDDNLLSQQIGYLANDAHVLAVSVFNRKGQVLQQQDNQAAIVTRYLNAETPPLTFIQEIRSVNNDHIGYLRIVLDETKLMQFHFDYQQQIIQQFELLLLLAAVAGGIVTRAFYTIRYRQYRRELREELNNGKVF